MQLLKWVTLPLNLSAWMHGLCLTFVECYGLRTHTGREYLTIPLWREQATLFYLPPQSSLSNFNFSTPLSHCLPTILPVIYLFAHSLYLLFAWVAGSPELKRSCLPTPSSSETQAWKAFTFLISEIILGSKTDISMERLWLATLQTHHFTSLAIHLICKRWFRRCLLQSPAFWPNASQRPKPPLGQRHRIPKPLLLPFLIR